MTAKELQKIRQQFPILARVTQGHPLVYVDNGATTQKPQCVINALTDYYTTYNANIHRGSYAIADQATQAFEDVRVRVQRMLGAREQEEIIFTKGTTEAINLVAQAWGGRHLTAGDEVIISHMEHHANIVPWQVICEQKRAKLHVIPVSDVGDLTQRAYEDMLTKRTKMVALTHVSNVLGTINPIREMAQKAHAVGAKVLVDGAQAIAHHALDVRALDVDFYAFSAHKAYGPLGTGVLYGKRALLEEMPPYQTGGEMVKEVTFPKTTYNALPYKFEAGTPNVGDVIAFGSAIDWMHTIGLANMAAHERSLCELSRTRLSQIKGLRILGHPKEQVGILSLCLDQVHPYDMGQFLGVRGICVRTGNHCADPLVRRFGLDSTMRISFAVYNTRQEVERICACIEEIREKLTPFASRPN